MKKTTLKLQWDNLQAINKIALEQSTIQQKKVTQDMVIRMLIENWSKKK
jgi:hypothetical protein